MKGIELISTSVQETQRIAKRLARALKKDDCLALCGDFGSGKTTFVKGLVEGLKVAKKNYVCSPSFVILKIYSGRLPVYHFDLYRLSEVRDCQEIGLFDFVAGGGVSVIEWADKVKRFLPPDTVEVKFTICGAQKRRLRFLTKSPRLMRTIGKLL
jgi:tRNA threonylcarbamoyladenosine biosynthesis protein TsaE